MICRCLIILGCVGIAVLFMGLDLYRPTRREVSPLVVPGIVLCWLIVLGLSIYFLVIIVKFYKEIASGHVDGFQQGVDLQPYVRLVSLEGGQALHAAPAHSSQDMSQQQPPQQ